MTPAAIDGFASRTVQVGGVKIHHWIGGDPDGPPVLLWHGFLGTGYVWRKIAPRLAEAGLSVLIPDMRGYGDSDKPDGTDGYDARSLAEEFRELVGTLGFGHGDPLVLVAFDMGAPPALLWAADHPGEISALLYLEEPVLLREVITRIICFERQAMERGSLWWWILPHAPGAPERLIVGNERAFLTWFYDRDASTRRSIDAAAVDEYLRTFSGNEGVLGALGVYRAVFTTMEQTAPLTQNKVRVPIVALGGERAQGDRVHAMISLVAENVSGGTVPDCGHFLPEERPDEITHHVLQVTNRTERR
ncbi:MAG TPA: alpha/beta hydrolase [Acidimicrobiales bacterium]|nr:alpha/beta hydrolase [Acidimicrobiales bacterium]